MIFLETSLFSHGYSYSSENAILSYFNIFDIITGERWLKFKGSLKFFGIKGFGRFLQKGVIFFIISDGKS